MQSLEQKYQTFSDKDLIKILRYRGDYTQEAIGIIEEILRLRAIDSQILDDILDEINKEDKAQKSLQEEYLNYWEKLLMVALPILGFILYVAVNIKEGRISYNRKIRQSLTYSLLGSIILAIFIIVWMNQ
ncbi:MAG: hypothetical protein AAF696_10025 [Bacteroidota bacterium]